MNDIWKKYEEIEKIGEGTFGKVIKAKNKMTHQYVAVKIIDKINLKKPNEYLNEVINMKQLSLENSVSLIEIYDTIDNIYVVMELCLFNLKKFIKIRNEKLMIDEIKEILFQLNQILKKMNENNILHGNLKLSNILISLNKINNISIKLSDFGLNKKQEITKNKVVINLAMAPEILENGNFSNKSDIWSLGIIIYFLLFNEYPYKGETEIQLNKDIHSNKIIKKSENKELNDLLNKMLCIDYNKRISWKEYFNHSFFKKNHQNLKLPDFNFKNDILRIVKFRCRDCLNIPLIGILYENEEIKIESRCQKGHYNIEKVEEFYKRNLINSSSIFVCSIGNESQDNNNKVFYCNDCNKLICSNHLKEHIHKKAILIDKIDNYCFEHNSKIISFCKSCSINLCKDCEKNHLNHTIINLDKFKLNEKEIQEYEEKINDIENNFKTFFKKIKDVYEEFEKYQINFINSIIRYKNINELLINFCKNLLEGYKEVNYENILNFEIIQNIKNIFNFKSIDVEIDKNFHILSKIQKYYSFMNNNYNCILERSKTFINIDYKITIEEKNYLLTQFKPIKKNLEFIEKYDIAQSGNYYYYGEIIREKGDIIRHGRGIYLYLNGTKTFGYFEDDKMNGYSLSYYRDGFISQCYKKDGTNEGFYLTKQADGLIIKGNYLNGLKHGFSILNSPNGNIIIEEYKDNKSEGYYLKYCLDGEKYEGEIKHGNKNGIGIQTTFRRKYEGEWKDDNKEGIGKLSWNYSKQKYEGEFKNNNFHGIGIFFLEDELKSYEGEYENGLCHGYGVDFYSNGKKSYEGFYKNGMESKFGICYLKDGFIYYMGYLENDKRNGFGIYKDKPNTKLIGYWKNDQIGSGPYVRFNSDGSWYKGFAKDRKFNGYGIYKWGDGDIYEGEWINDVPHGYGIYKYNNNSIYKGQWKNYNREGYGEYIVPGERIYRGEWKNNQRNGYGIEKSENLNKIQFGYYKDGELINKL